MKKSESKKILSIEAQTAAKRKAFTDNVDALVKAFDKKVRAIINSADPDDMQNFHPFITCYFARHKFLSVDVNNLEDLTVDEKIKSEVAEIVTEDDCQEEEDKK